MHSLRPSGDNIAQEFLKLMEKKSLSKSASDVSSDTADAAKALSDQGDSVESVVGGLGTTEDAREWSGHLQDALAGDVQQADSADDGLDDGLLEGMITDENMDQLTPGFEAIDEAIADAADDFALNQTASEKRVLVGLSKIAGSLRAKGEAFAADVVEATAISIKGDLQKEARRRSHIVSELKKLASEFYKGNDPLAGDMVAVTINKLGGDPFEDMDKELDKQSQPQDKSKFAKDEAAIPATLKAAKAEVAKETDMFKEMDIWLSYGITMTASHNIFELQSGEKVKMAKR